MEKHIAKYPQTRMDYEGTKITARQAERLAAIAGVKSAELAGKSIRELRAKPEFGIDPAMLFGRRICGRVVKKDPNGNNLPVPFATVNVYDTDITGVFWSQSSGISSWFFPLHVSRERLATVVTDECGRFCVTIPFFDIDFILRWRIERHCYLEWLRKPTIRDILERYEVFPPVGPGPGPDPRKIRVDDHLMRHAERLLDTKQTKKLRKLATDAVPGASNTEVTELLDTPRWTGRGAAPLPVAIRESLASKDRVDFMAKTGMPEKLAAAFDPRRAFGPFLRCDWHIVPEWQLILDIPDITFEVTQDVNGDGVQDSIYSENLFDVRWDANAIPDIELVAGPNAVASITCDSPLTGPCGDPAILFAGNYELQQPGNPTQGHDRVSGYALFPNVPRAAGNPSGARLEPGLAPFRSNFYLWGCSERPGANRYRIKYTFTPINGGPAVNGVLGGVSWTLTKLVGGVVQYLPVADIGGWYPIVPRADGWTPSGLLALVPGGLATGRYDLVMEFGNLVGAAVTPVAGSSTQAYALMIDDTAPTNPGITQIEWRVTNGGAWAPLPLGACPVVARGGALAIQFRVTFSTAAYHLRDVTIAASGCGPTATPTVNSFSTGPDTYYQSDSSTIRHWHSSSSDNSSAGTVVFDLAANAPAGCYNFGFTAVSRAIDPNQPGNNTANSLWHTDPTVIYSPQTVTVSVQ